MNKEIKRQLSHILWIGGATDSGKSTIAENLASRWEASVYHYDRHDAEQMEKLAKTLPEIDGFLGASMEERWIQPTPGAMFDFLLSTFPHRFELVIESLLEMPRDKIILVEGFGLLPELVDPVLSDPCQAIWLVPTETFKWESMIRRGKPSFASTLSDPEKARLNLFARDMLLAEYYRRQAGSHGHTLLEVDGSRPAGEMTDLVEDHFAKYLARLAR